MGNNSRSSERNEDDNNVSSNDLPSESAELGNTEQAAAVPAKNGRGLIPGLILFAFLASSTVVYLTTSYTAAYLLYGSVIFMACYDFASLSTADQEPSAAAIYLYSTLALITLVGLLSFGMYALNIPVMSSIITTTGFRYSIGSIVLLIGLMFTIRLLFTTAVYSVTRITNGLHLQQN